MRYVYKQTGVIVESDRVLDSAIFTPVKDEPEQTSAEPKKTTSRKTTRTTKK